MELRGKKILIVGLGRSGLAAARYCLRSGAEIVLNDARPLSELKLDLAEFAGAALHFGSHPEGVFTSADMIVISPGVPLSLAAIEAAKAAGVPVVGEMELAEISSKIIAVTGTNGKSTVTTLIGEMLKAAGLKVAVGGNLGTPLLEMIDEVNSADWTVLEVSSYQLEITPSFHPDIALLLNVTPDHLDRYSGYEEYVFAKALIAKHQTAYDTFIFNSDDPVVAKISEDVRARKIPFSGRRVPQLEGVDFSKAKISGQHNLENLIAATYAATTAGVANSEIQRVIETFSGLPHRNQFVRELGGVKYFDDSKGTNVGAVVKSLEGFDEKIILIAGGLDKGGGYEPMKPLVKDRVKAMILIGTATELMANEFHGLTKIVRARDMKEAVKFAADEASAGDVVLLSPACASMDMFKNYAERGDVFANEVRKL